MRNPDRHQRAAPLIKYSDATETAWWLGLMTNGRSGRAIRALRILVEAVE
jgi:hypothetical protein